MAWTESPWENPDGAPFGICWEKGGGRKNRSADGTGRYYENLRCGRDSKRGK